MVKLFSLANAIAALALNGCVFVVNPDGDEGNSAHWAWDYDSDKGEYSVGSNSSAVNAGLARAVGQALEKDPDLSNRRINVTAENRDITLHGEIASVEEFNRAMAIALSVDGVDEVISRMTVRVPRGTDKVTTGVSQ